MLSRRVRVARPDAALQRRPAGNSVNGELTRAKYSFLYSHRPRAGKLESLLHLYKYTNLGTLKLRILIFGVPV